MRVKLGKAGKGVALAAAAVLTLTMTMSASPEVNPAYAGPGSPGVVQPGTIVWEETFGDGAVPSAVSLSSYNSSYSVDPAWRTGAGNCNGWILNSVTPSPGIDNCNTAGGMDNSGAGDATTTAWWHLQQMAYALGQAQGMVTPGLNAAVSSETAGNTAQPADQPVEFQAADVASINKGSYYQASVYLAATHCKAKPSGFAGSSTVGNSSASWNDPLESIYFVVDGVRDTTPMVSNFNPCTGIGTARDTSTVTLPVTVYTVNGQGWSSGKKYQDDVATVEFTSPALQINSGTKLGLAVLNNQNMGGGNDVAFDLPKITEVTPQLDKTFSPAKPDAGQTSMLTFTITNTKDLLAKGDDGFTFSDLLDDGLKVASTPATDCGEGDVSSGTDSSGRDFVALANGTLDDGQESCTVTVKVTSDIAGTYTNTPDNMETMYGLNPPGKTSVTFEPPTLTLAKTASPSKLEAPGTVTYSFDVTNNGHIPVDNLAIDDTDFSGANGPLGSLSCAPVALGGTLNGQSSTTCTVSYVVDQGEFDLGTAITNTATASGTHACKTDAEGLKGVCTATSDPDDATVTIDQKPQLTLSKSNDSGHDSLHEGEAFTYTLVAKNPGNVTITDVSLDDTGTTPAENTPGFTGTGGPLVVTCGTWPSGTTGVLAPGDMVTCTAPYTVTAADAAKGSIDNTAEATGKDPSGNAMTAFASSTAPTTTDPAITLDKEHLPLPSNVAAGDDVTYTFTVSSSGNVPVSNIAVTDPKIGTVTCPGTGYDWPDSAKPGVLMPGDSVTCTGSYTLTQADIDAGHVDNTAEATASSDTLLTLVAATPATDTDTLTGLSQPSIKVDKTADKSSVDAPGNIKYSFTLTNTGNVKLTDVQLDDPMVGLSGYTCERSVLAPGASASCVAFYPVTQDVLDHQSMIANTAVATGTPPTGADVTGRGTAYVDVAQTPAISVQKTASPTSLSAPGTVTYTFEVTNEGNVSLSDVRLDDMMLGLTSAECGATTLGPGESTSCTATYDVSQDQIDAGVSLTNTVTATGTPGVGTDVTATDSATIDMDGTSAISLNKVASVSSVEKAGDTIDYTLTVTNTGHTTMSDITVADTDFNGRGTAPAIDCPKTVLVPGASMDCTASYTLVQRDIDHLGTIVNTAQVTADDPGGATKSATSTATVNVDSTSGISLVKTADPTSAYEAGNVIHYTLTVENTGYTRLHYITVTDTAFNGNGTAPSIHCPRSTLAPGRTMDCTAHYTVVQDDIDQLTSIDNTAQVTSRDASGVVHSDESTASVDLSPTSEISIDKQADASSLTKAGDVVNYTLTVTNSGNTTMSDITVTDRHFNGLGSAPVIDCPDTTLSPGQTMDCTSSYAVVQADIDRLRSINNAAQVTGTDPFGQAASDVSSARVRLRPSSSISIDKSSDVSSVTAAGDVIVYTMTVTNTGDTTLRNIDVTDSHFNGLGTALTVDCPDTTLSPGSTMDCTADYTVVQDDVDQLSSIDNTANVTATDSWHRHQFGRASASVDVQQEPAISLTKSFTPNAATLRENDVITYHFVIENTGNVTLTNIYLDESGTTPDATTTGFTGTGTLLGISCPSDPADWGASDEVGTLAPGDQVTCSAPYTVTATDAGNGTIDNTAKVTGTPPASAGVTSVSDYSSANAPTAPDPKITLDKEHLTVPSPAHSGDVVIYTFTVKNEGNVPVDTISVTDPKIGAVSCPGAGYDWPDALNPGVLIPGQSIVCIGTYTLTQADINAGEVDNSATASATSESSTRMGITGDSSDELTSLSQPGLTLVKTADPTDATALAAGGSIVYSFKVTNTGNTTLTDVIVSEDAFDGSGTPHPTAVCPSDPADWPSGVIGTLEPDDHITCTATYVLTQADMDASAVNNTASATGTDPAGDDVVSEPSTIQVTDGRPELSLKESAALKGTNIVYTFLVSNTGTMTLDGITLSQTGFTGSGPAPKIVCPKTVLAPGESMQCTAVYAIRFGDLGKTIQNPTIVVGIPTHRDQPSAQDNASIKVPMFEASTGGSVASSPVLLYAIAGGLVLIGAAAALIIFFMRRKKKTVPEETDASPGSDQPTTAMTQDSSECD